MSAYKEWRIDMKKIKAHWCYFDNFGDAINPYLLSKLSGLRVCYRNYKNPNYLQEFKRIIHSFINRKKYDFNRLRPYNANEQVLLCIGSILSRCRKNFIIWGAGFMNNDEKTIECGKICAIRGNFSARKLGLNIKNTDVAIGDPAILLPLVYKPQIKKKYKIGIIPHIRDYKYAKKKYCNYHIINIATSDIESVINEILECEIIFSSSLHGIIVSHAYGIPALWIKLGDINTDGIKFQDYFDSVGIDEYDSNMLNIDSIIDVNYEEYPKEMKKSMLPTCDLTILQKNLLLTAPFLLREKYKHWIYNL